VAQNVKKRNTNKISVAIMEKISERYLVVVMANNNRKLKSMASLSVNVSVQLHTLLYMHIFAHMQMYNLKT